MLYPVFKYRTHQIKLTHPVIFVLPARTMHINIWIKSYGISTGKQLEIGRWKIKEMNKICLRFFLFPK